MKVVNWNVEWAGVRSDRGRRIREVLAAEAPGVICMTEGTAELLPDSGELLESEPDYGYGVQAKRRKVLLWARDGFSRSRVASPPGMPSGRFVEGVLRKQGIRVIGVCVPWPFAHVGAGQRNRRPWEDHLAYLTALSEYRQSLGADPPLLVLGDFNQTLPRTRAPRQAHEMLLRTLDGLEVLTAGRDAVPALLDHAAASPGLALRSFALLPVLSDHSGWSGEVHFAESLDSAGGRVAHVLR